MHESEFPPNKYQIWARLTHPYVDPLDFDSLTCDEAAQIISGIDSNGFNQADADDFEHISLLINRCIIAKTIPSIESDGKTYVKTLDVVKWAISWAETGGYELPSDIVAWFIKQNTTRSEGNKHNTPEPWEIINQNDPQPDQPWYTPARYFAREFVKNDQSLLNKRDLLAQKVSKTLYEKNITKRGGKLALNPGTVLKAFSNIDLSENFQTSGESFNQNSLADQ